MSFYFQSLVTSSGKALLLVFADKKYMFNCFEGFQRYSIDAKSRISKLTAILLPTQYSVVPFIGTYLTMGDMGVKKLKLITLHKETMECAQFFGCRPDLKLEYCKEFEDNRINIETYEDNEFLNAIIDIQPIRGKFNEKKAKEEGIPPMLWNLLCNKEEVKFKNKIYNGNHFLDADTEFDKIAVIFNASKYSNFKALSDVKIIFCFYQATAKILHEKIKSKIYILDDSRFVDFSNFYKLQTHLNNIYDCFGLPVRTNIIERLEINNECKYLESCDKLTYCKTTKTYIIDHAKLEKFVEQNRSKTADNYILFLGTGAAIPSQYRNVSSILLKYNSKYTLLDCGEDTYYNIIRYFGNDSILKDIDTIFISHSHADHHLGAVKVIQSVLAYSTNIKVICPKNVADFIKLFVNKGVEFYSTLVKRYKPHFNEHFIDIDEYILTLDTIPKISICSVPHMNDSVGIRIDYNDFSIGYSGDCRPSHVFTKMISNVDVLIHEATFSDDLREKALKTKHSTISEAVDVAKKAQIETLILTHFSQRYPKKIEIKNVIVAFDYFKYDIKNFDKKKYYQCLDKLAELENE